jgi:hypothetical protein
MNVKYPDILVSQWENGIDSNEKLAQLIHSNIWIMNQNSFMDRRSLAILEVSLEGRRGLVFNVSYSYSNCSFKSTPLEHY